MMARARPPRSTGQPLADTSQRRTAKQARHLAEDLLLHRPVPAHAVATVLVEAADLLDDWPVHIHRTIDDGMVEVPVTQAVWDATLARTTGPTTSGSPGQ